MWHMKCMVIPVVNGVTGITTKGSKKKLESIPVKIQYTQYKDSYSWNSAHNAKSIAV
jgi:hypothetical protein